METIKQFRNELLKRQEISVSLEAEKNPGFDEMKKQIAEKFKKDENLTDVYNIKGSFGSKKFKVDAYIYDSKEELDKNKIKSKKQKSEEKKKEAGEEKTEESKAKEKKEKTDKSIEQKQESGVKSSKELAPKEITDTNKQETKE